MDADYVSNIMERPQFSRGRCNASQKDGIGDQEPNSSAVHYWCTFHGVLLDSKGNKVMKTSRGMVLSSLFFGSARIGGDDPKTAFCVAITVSIYSLMCIAEPVHCQLQMLQILATCSESIIWEQHQKYMTSKKIISVLCSLSWTLTMDRNWSLPLWTHGLWSLIHIVAIDYFTTLSQSVLRWAPSAFQNFLAVLERTLLLLQYSERRSLLWFANATVKQSKLTLCL